MAQTEKSLRDLTQATASRAEAIAGLLETEVEFAETLLFSAKPTGLDKGATPPTVDSVEGDITRINDALSRIGAVGERATQLNARIGRSAPAEGRAMRAA